MSFSTSLPPLVRWLHLPAVLLLTLLQRMPLLRFASAAPAVWRGAPLASLLRCALPVAALGELHAQAGATQFRMVTTGGTVLSNPISATVGLGISPVVFTVTGASAQPGSFRIAGSVPGLAVAGLNANGLINSSTGTITGVPTTPGTYSFSVTAYHLANGQGDSIGPNLVTFNVVGASAAPPVFTQQPFSQSVAAGATVTFVAAANGTPPPTYQWRKDGSEIPGATGATYTIVTATAADAGLYTVVATNSSGSVTSTAATLAVQGSGGLGVARLSNLSVRTALAAGQNLIVGFVVAGGGSRDILVRAAGPALAGFNLPGAMEDPQLDLYRGASWVLANDNWPAALAATFGSVGAFAFAPGSRDAAFVYGVEADVSVHARGAGGGIVLVEAYDLGTGQSPRLVNLSARNFVGTGDDILIAGFALTGTGKKRLLIRGVGPALAAFGISGALADPVVELSDGAGKLAENDDWAPELAATFASVSAFSFTAGSRDAALIATLDAGASYTVQVRGVGGTTGEALIEIYELP